MSKLEELKDQVAVAQENQHEQKLYDLAVKIFIAQIPGIADHTASLTAYNVKNLKRLGVHDLDPGEFSKINKAMSALVVQTMADDSKRLASLFLKGYADGQPADMTVDQLLAVVGFENKLPDEERIEFKVKLEGLAKEGEVDWLKLPDEVTREERARTNGWIERSRKSRSIHFFSASKIQTFVDNGFREQALS